ncbi:MAG: hypothetical protein RMK30_09515 [Anaerolineae bacterium]|nr:hypothetical protein [Anaerolineae bacterium]
MLVRGVRVRFFSLFQWLALIILLLIPQSSIVPPANVFDYQIESYVSPYQFSFAIWEARALWRKAAALPIEGSSNETQLVKEYFSLLEEISRKKDLLTRLYAGERTRYSGQAIWWFEEELRVLRQRQASLSPRVEKILEKQVSETLKDEGLTTLGFIWPPLSFQFESPPLYLVIAPRDALVVRKGIYLQPDMLLKEQEALEEKVDRLFNVSSLVVGVGGLSSYPAMILDYPSLEFALKAIAHEWFHHYLLFRPLGWHYGDSPDMMAINETVASIAGDEIGIKTLRRYYPELAPPPPKEEEVKEPIVSEFQLLMRETRLKVEELLKAGDIEGAERYMEERRKLLVSKGYYIRKLNQAYFAFFGSYAAEPGHPNPIGEKLRLLRRRTGSLREFIRLVEGISSPEGLERVLQKVQQSQ